ncbi:MAG: MFS transporter [Planctomycetota bacterium]|nr:MFS transporter [Planctomycetota bacterium]
MDKPPAKPDSALALPAAAPALRDETAAPPGKSIFSYAAFNKLFIGSLCGTFADRLYFTALIAAAYIIYADNAPEDYKGQIQIFATIPLLILYGFSGPLVDSLDRRRLLALVKGLKAVIVLLFVPLLWRVVDLNLHAPDPQVRTALVHLWPWCLALVVLLNILTVPFGPARAAAIPDVVPEKHRSLGASLMATSGLVSLLLAAMAGGILARTDVLGPALTTVIGSAFYVIATLLFLWLPDAVAVPGNKRPRAEGEAEAPAVKEGAAAYLSGLWDGVRYCCRRGSILGLIFFESVFWTVGSAFYILMDFHARTVFHLSGNALVTFSGMAMGIAGVGLFAGAIGAGKVCNRISPILTYPLSFLLLSCGLYVVFCAAAADGGAPYWLYPIMFLLGLGGGGLLGRVDADVLAITEGPVRGRVFAIKAVAFAATILVTITILSEGKLTDMQKEQLAHWTPRLMFTLLPVAIVFSWLVDLAIWASRGITEPPRGIHQAGYRLARFLLRQGVRALFRYEVQGAEKIPKSGPVILAANHASFIDPILLGCCTRRIVQYTMYASYYRSFAHPVFRFLRCIPVDATSTLAALKANARSLSQGACLGIFPEGHVSVDGRMQPPKEGALFLAQRSGAPVVPVTLKGNFAALPRGAWLPRLRKITVSVGDPFTVGKDLSREQVAELTDKMMAGLAATLGLEPPPKSVVRGKEPGATSQ